MRHVDDDRYLWLDHDEKMIAAVAVNVFKPETVRVTAATVIRVPRDRARTALRLAIRHMVNHPQSHLRIGELDHAESALRKLVL